MSHLRTVYRQKCLECMLFSDTALLTSRFISSSVTKANCSPIWTLILIVNKTHLEVFEIGEYHLGNIFIVYLMDYNSHWFWGV